MKSNRDIVRFKISSLNKDLFNLVFCNFSPTPNDKKTHYFSQIQNIVIRIYSLTRAGVWVRTTITAVIHKEFSKMIGF